MNELIPINYENENPTVSGRALHDILSVKEKYTDWFRRMRDYGFAENTDFLLVSEITETNNPKNPTTIRTDHELTISMAKELCMLQRTSKGKECRRYFISIEESWNSPDKVMARALKIAERRILGLTEEKESLEIALNESLKFYTVAKYNKVFNKGWNLKKCQYIGKNLTAYCRARAIEIRKCQTNDERFGETNSYPITAWEDFLKSKEINQ